LLGDFATNVDFDALREKEVKELGGTCVGAGFENFGVEVTGPAEGKER